MTIENFLSRFVDGYLLHDLENMASLQCLPGCDAGAAVYPLLMTTLSGIELLGGLISQNKFDKYKNDEYFSNYWNKYLLKVDQQYKGFEKLVRNLIRHGLAHTFLTKHGVLVVKYSGHLKSRSAIYLDLINKTVVVDCVKFCQDFKTSYQQYIRPVIFENINTVSFSKDSVQQRLDEMNDLYSKESEKEFADYLKQEITYTSLNGLLASGASLSASGISATTNITTLPFSKEDSPN